MKPHECPESIARINDDSSFDSPVQESSVEPTLADVTVGLTPIIENPFRVLSADGRLLGSAVLTMGKDRFYLRFILDPHNPESFDLTQEPDRCRVDLQATLKDGVLNGVVRLTSK